jgi:hypothetical protein
MAETFLNLALIYIVIITSCFGYYYLAKAIASNKKNAEKGNGIHPLIAMDDSTKIINLRNNLAPVSATENKITGMVISIKKKTEPAIKIEPDTVSIIPINKEDNTPANYLNQTHTVITDKAITTVSYQNSIVPALVKLKDEIKEPIKPIEKNIEPDIKKQYPTDVEVAINEKDNPLVIQPTEAYQPQLNLFKQNTQTGKGRNAGLIKTIYYFGCEEGYSIFNPTIEIIFKNRFADISGGISGAGIITTNYLAKHSFDDNTRFVITTDLLLPGNHIFIQAISRKELQIEGLKITV